METVVEVKLGGGGGHHVAFISQQDEERVHQFNWYAKKKVRSGRVTWIATSTSIHNHSMHRFVMDAPPGVTVDHRNRNSLDNRRSNLRFATTTENNRNTRPHAGSASQFKGVYHQRPFRANIRVNGKLMTLGTFTSEEEAARAYDAAAREHFGEFAYLNFPDDEAPLDLAA